MKNKLDNKSTNIFLQKFKFLAQKGPTRRVNLFNVVFGKSNHKFSFTKGIKLEKIVWTACAKQFDEMCLCLSINVRMYENWIEFLKRTMYNCSKN